ncbi:MAG: efflux RND transporter periplasmic adaptor subunit [Ahniella sp.]|nr:efflux RND transporter periplasmic adaptor subunit [Ahniella sp.]
MLSVSMGLIAGCGGKDKAAEVVRPAIVANPVALEALAIESYSGDVRARYQSSLGFRVAGKIRDRLVDNGAVVKAGQVLAELEPQDIDLQRTASEAAVASAEADLALANSELERHRQLLEKNYISQALFDARSNQQKAASARFEQAKAQLNVARNQSSYTTLSADADGVITQWFAEVGQVVAAGQPIVGLARSGEMETQIDVPESRVGEFGKGRPVIVQLWAERGSRYAGKVREVSPSADQATRTYSVRVAFDEADQAVKLGMSTRVFFTDSAAPSAVLIPLSALHEKDRKPAVWVLDPAKNAVQLREVQVGQYREDGVTIIAGLTTEDRVVTAGVHKLRPGQVIKPVDLAMAR